MPELPEVQTIVTHLNKKILSLPIVSIDCHLSRIYEGEMSIFAANQLLIKKSIQSIKRRGKYIIIFFNQVSKVLIVHLGMSGQLIFNEGYFSTGVTSFKTLTGLKIFKPGTFIKPDKHCHFIIRFTKKRSLIFRDPRTFGKIILSDKDHWQYHPRIKKLGLEPLTTTTNEFLKTWPRRSARCVKALLLDQSILAGIGNIYADEALFLARLHPETKGLTLAEADIKKLIKKVKVVLKKGIDNFGTTFSNFIHPDGKMGDNYEYLNVYGRKGEPCKRCKKILVKSKIAGRGSVFCLNCQKQ